ncbi:MAG: P-loop NTPase fold protein, partial [Ginsengibacter sp.]
MFTDSIAKKDLLGRREFAQHIAKKLFKSSEIDASGFVTALTGKWGIGKSTLLSFIEDELHELCINNPKYKFISFNPWMFADEADIKKVFLKNLAKGVNENKYERVKEKWGNKIAKLVRFISSLWPGAKEPGNILSDLIEKYCSKNFIQYKSVIDKKLLDSNLKLFVFIDDIDRLIPKQVFEILQILKLTCNFKNTYYIIAYDREAVEISIETQFKDYGRKFLDKIVQADFLIPEAPLEKIEIIFFSEIEKIRNDFSIVFDSSALSSIWLHRGLKSYFATLRDVYRYINSIRFSLPAIAHEVDVNDFIILEAIRIYDFEKYEKIYTDYSLKIFSFGVAIEFGTDKYLELINNRITRQLVSFLFPQKEYLKKADKKRLNDPDYFFRYFTLQLTSKDVAEFELQKIMLDEERRRELLNTILEQNRMNNLVVRLNDSNLNLKYKEWN